MIEKNIYLANQDPHYAFIQWVRETILLNLLSEDAGLFDEYITPLKGILFTFIDSNFLKKKIEEVINKSFGPYLKIQNLDIQQTFETINIKIKLEIASEDNPLIDIYDLDVNHNIELVITF